MANDYIDDVSFLAVAGRGDIEATRVQAVDLFSGNLLWGLDDGIWSLYRIPGQPAVVLIANGIVVDMWFGALAESEMRERLDALVLLSS